METSTYTILTGSNPLSFGIGVTKDFHFSISNELGQIIKFPARAPKCHYHVANTLGLFFTSNPQNNTYTVFSSFRILQPLYCFSFFIHYSTTTCPSYSVSSIWHFEKAWRAVMRDFLLNFPWSDYCFWTRNSDLATTAAEEVVISRMRVCIPSSLTSLSPSNPWFDHVCSSAI